MRAGRVELLLIALAPDRILWGTDYPLLSQGKFLKRVRASGLTPEELEGVLGGNAARLLRLE